MGEEIIGAMTTPPRGWKKIAGGDHDQGLGRHRETMIVPPSTMMAGAGGQDLGHVKGNRRVMGQINGEDMIESLVLLNLNSLVTKLVEPRECAALDSLARPNNIIMFEAITRPLSNAINPNTIAWAVGALVPVVIGVVFFRSTSRQPGTVQQPTAGSQGAIMSAPRADLAAPLSDPYTLEELRRYDGSDPSLPVYVSIKGTVFDVSPKRNVYGPPDGSYRVFAGKDASKALGLSSLKAEDAEPDWSKLEPKEMQTLNEWYAFFKKRYNVVGRVVDMPASVAQHVWPTAKEGPSQ